MVTVGASHFGKSSGEKKSHEIYGNERHPNSILTQLQIN